MQEAAINQIPSTRQGELMALALVESPYARELQNTMGTSTLSAPPVGATQEIWAEFGHRLRGFIARRVDSAADADDILQEVFLRIHRHAGTVERRERLTSWLFQVTRNAITDYYRAAGRREVPAGAPYDLEGEGAVAIGSGADSDAEPAAHRELATCLKPMIERLPPHYREAVLLIDLEGLSQKEAAVRAGLSLSGMKSRVQRGRQALGELMQECCLVELDAGGHVADYQPRGAGCASPGHGCGCNGGAA
jgi:RNA polymerase sigma-70 factor (ECF subfamily)